MALDGFRPDGYDIAGVVRRLIDEVMNHGNLSVLEDLYSVKSTVVVDEGATA
jgi:hypothetical protein